MTVATMDVLDLHDDFLAQLESVDMPDYLRTAILEAFSFSHEIDNTPLTDEEIQQRLDVLERGNKANGMPFDRKAIEADMHVHPNKYRRIPIPTRPMNMKRMMHNSGLHVPGPFEARRRFYQAAVKSVADMYKKYGVNFDAQGQLNFILDNDAKSKHGEFDRSLATNPLVFSSFDEANRNATLFQLKTENMALYDMMKTAYLFLKGLRLAYQQGEAGAYLMKYRFQHKDDKAPVVEPPKAELTGDDAAEFEKQELANKNSKALSNVRIGPDMDILGLAKEYPGIPYSDLYAKYAEVAPADKLAMIPKPTERLYSYVSRLNKGDNMVMPFMRVIHQYIDVAYPQGTIDGTLKEMLDSSSEFKKVYQSVCDSLDGVFVHPNDKNLYTLWKTASILKSASAAA